MVSLQVGGYVSKAFRALWCASGKRVSESGGIDEVAKAEKGEVSVLL